MSGNKYGTKNQWKKFQGRPKCLILAPFQKSHLKGDLNPIKPGTFWTFITRGGRSAPKLSPELLEGETCIKKGLKLSSPNIWPSLTQFRYLSHWLSSQTVLKIENIFVIIGYSRLEVISANKGICPTLPGPVLYQNMHIQYSSIT